MRQMRTFEIRLQAEKKHTKRPFKINHFNGIISKKKKLEKTTDENMA